MALTKMTVSAEQGNSAKVAAFPYQFYAQIGGNTSVINILMPLGGKESGLFRFPKSGEVVMVDQDSDNNYYLRGYLPSESDAANNFLANLNGGNGEEQTLEAERGIILRYEQTGLKKPPAYDPNDTSELYSEIGFYHRPTQWKAGRDSKGNYNDFDTKNPDIPLIDQINIQSSGDIHAKAVNHHMMKAERIEILAGVPEVLDRKTNAVDEHGTLPLGDFPGDDSSLHREDLHIRAANRIIIKADQEIRLQVGRAVLRIDDTGFNVITRSVAGNYINSYDTMLDMSPRNGINLTGKNINLRAGCRFNAGDGLGGMAAATMGNLNLGGREISIDAYNNTEYMFNLLYQGLEYMVNAASGGMALAKDDIKIADYINFAQQSLEQLIRLARQVSELFAKRKEIKYEQYEEQHEFTADFVSPDGFDLPTNTDEMRTNHDEALKQFAENMGERAKQNIADQARSDDPETIGPSAFLADLSRDTDMEVDGIKLPTRITDENRVSVYKTDKDAERTLHQQADDIIGDFLAGLDPTFTSQSPEEQKQQIHILEAMCCQVPANEALKANSRDILGEDYYLASGASSPKVPYKLVMKKDDDGNIEITVTGTNYAGVLMKLCGGCINLDPFKSTNKATGSFSISPDELKRLSRLNWNNGVSWDQLPAEYKPRFAKKSLTGRINLRRRQ